MENLAPGLADKYLPYLIEIRRRLLFLVCLFIIGSVLGFFYYEPVIRLILALFNLKGVNIVFTSPFQLIELAVNSSLLIGLLITLPVIIYQFLSFIKPALVRQEFRMIVRFIPLTLFLFLIGFIYGLLTMRSTLEIFYRQSQELGLGNILDVSHLLSIILTTSILLGVAFEFPIVLTLAMHFGIISRHWMAKIRPVFYVVSIIFVIFLPPTDLLSDFLLELPLALLFELTLIFNRFLFKPARLKGGEHAVS